MPENANRTFICSVLFLDIVEYSKRSVSEQIKLKEQFNGALSGAIAGVAVDNRIILDTGDGAAVSFLGDPEDAMFVGLDMRDAIAGQPATGARPLLVRLGINLGPVRLVKDINGQPNIIGDGINVAQRVMSFAEPGQILVSRSYYDVMARLSDDYGEMFHYEGAKTDKHVREHEVYAVGAAPRRLRPPASATVAARHHTGLASLSPRALATSFDVNSKLLLAAPLAFIVIVGAGAVLRGYRVASHEEQPLSARVPAQPAVTTAKVEASKSAPVVEAHQAETPKATPKAVLKAEASARTRPAERRESAAASAAAPNAVVNITALPWAEIYVDGRNLGVSPPLRSVPVAPGVHRVELKNSSFPAYAETIDVKAGQRVTIRHRFRP